MSCSIQMYVPSAAALSGKECAENVRKKWSMFKNHIVKNVASPCVQRSRNTALTVGKTDIISQRAEHCSYIKVQFQKQFMP